MNKSEIQPKFHEVATDQEWFSADGVASLSLLLPPSTPEHFAAQIAAPEDSDEPHRTQYLDINTMRESHSEDIERIFAEYKIRRIAKAETGELLELRIVNEAAETGTIGVMTSWSTDAEWVNTQGIVEALANTYPDNKIVFIATPGMGKSTNVPKSGLRKMIKSGSFEVMAKQMADALANTDITFDTLVGVSEGGRTAISLAAELGTETVVTVDPPGTTKQFITTFGRKFGIKEQAGQKKVMEHTPDIAMAEAHKDIDSNILAKQGLAAASHNLLARARVMAKDGLANDVRAAVESGSTIVDYRAGGSSIADASIAAELAKDTPGYNAVVLKDAPHSITEGSPYAVAALVEQALYLLESKKR